MCLFQCSVKKTCRFSFFSPLGYNILWEYLQNSIPNSTNCTIIYICNIYPNFCQTLLLSFNYAAYGSNSVIQSLYLTGRKVLCNRVFFLFGTDTALKYLLNIAEQSFSSSRTVISTVPDSGTVIIRSPLYNAAFSLPRS